MHAALYMIALFCNTNIATDAFDHHRKQVSKPLTGPDIEPHSAPRGWPDSGCGASNLLRNSRTDDARGTKVPTAAGSGHGFSVRLGQAESPHPAFVRRRVIPLRKTHFKLLTGLALQQKPRYLGRDRTCALIEFRRREVCDRVLHHEEAKFRNAPAPRHGAAGQLEHVRDDRRRRNAVLFKYYAVEHTARAA